MRQNTLIIYLFVVAAFVILTTMYLINGGSGIVTGVVAITGFASIITSLLPFFVSRYLFKKAEPYTHYRRRYQTAAIIVYLFCFPVKTWAICMTIDLMMYGEGTWAFG